MITRVHADNFKCLSNFDLAVEPFTLLLGPNGCGKSSVLELLRLLSDLLCLRGRTPDLFGFETLTRWDQREEQLLGVDVRLSEGDLGGPLASGTYAYSVRISHDRLRGENRIVDERLNFEGIPLYHGRLDQNAADEFRGSGIPSFLGQLYKDSGERGPEVAMDWHLSGVGRVQATPANRLLMRFRRFFERMVVLGINPASVAAEAPREAAMIEFDGSNFASWLRYLVGAEAVACRAAERSLHDGPLPGLALFQLEAEGVARVAKAIFAAKPKPISFRLNELSAGQRAMVILEHALAVAIERGGVLVVDEPANFLALQEVQPLLARIKDLTAEGRLQAVLTSHHPIAYDLFAEHSGWWLERSPIGPTRPSRISARLEAEIPEGTELPLSELAARGFISDTPQQIGKE